MSAARAFAWKEARQLRSNVIALAVLAFVGPMVPIVGGAVRGGDDAHRVVALTTLAVVALLLGATARAGDGAPGFEAMQPLARSTMTLVRLGLRVAVLLALVGLTALSVVIAARGGVDVPPENQPSWALLPWIVAPLLAAALSSAFRNRPIEAALDSLWILPLGTFATMPAIAVSVGAWGVATAALLGVLAFLAITGRLQGRPVRRILARVSAVAGCSVAAILALWLVAGGLVATARLQHAKAAWESRVGPLDAPERFPTRPANEAGRKLDELARPLGISLAPKSGSSTTEREMPELTRARAAVEAHLRAVLAAPLPRGVEAPVDVEAFLAEHALELEAIRAHALAGEIPTQSLGVEGGFTEPIPNLLGHFRLQKLLLGDAVVAASHGQRERARRDVETAIRVNEGLTRQPSLIAQLIATASARLQVAALRTLDESDAAPLLARIDVAALREGMSRAHGVEAWAFLRAADWSSGEMVTIPDGKPPSNLAGRIVLPAVATLTRPAVRLLAASQVEDGARAMEAARALSACDLVFGITNVPEPSSRAARWFPLLAQLGPPRPQPALSRVAVLEVEAELTRAVLAARAARSADPAHAWPAELPEAASAACPGERWVYETTADGGMRLAAWRQPPDLGASMEPRLAYAEGP